MTDASEPNSVGRRLDLKGKRAERIVHELAEHSFLADWCYPNPKLPSGKELCDLLVVHDDTAIIWSTKDLTPYSPQKAEKGLRQLGGARRQLLELRTPIELENPRRGRELFDPSPIHQVFLISVLMGEQPHVLELAEEVRKQRAHVFTREAVQILLEELDTISDFTDYLRRKEALLAAKQGIVIVGGEQELLALYLLGSRSFDSLREPDILQIDEGHWDALQGRREYQRRKKADEVSYLWDAIIDRAHQAGSNYELIARELARPNRFERRVLMKAFLGAHTQANRESERQGNPDSFVYRRVSLATSTTFCFLFMDDPESRERRKQTLGVTCFVARGYFQDRRRVVGIATETRIDALCSYDFCLLEIDPWTNEHQAAFEKTQRETGILVDPVVTHVHHDEYPPERTAPTET